MSPLALRRSLLRIRRSALGALAPLALCAAVAAHHSGAGMGMTDGMHHGGADAVVELCMGVLTAVGAAVVAIALGLLVRRRWPLAPVLSVPGRSSVHRTRDRHLARAGPLRAALLSVWRR